MEMRNTSCCAIQEIVELRTHPNPAEAMATFCKQNLIDKPKFFEPKRDAVPIPASGGEIFCFYLFTANVDAGKYGQDFAQFILENNLGTLVTTVPKSNRAFHGEQRCQAWIWTVDQPALKAWWKVNRGKPEAPPDSIVGRI